MTNHNIQMQKASDQGVYRQLDEILYVDGYPGYQHLFSVAKDTMNMVCEVKGDIFFVLFRFVL